MLAYIPYMDPMGYGEMTIDSMRFHDKLHLAFAAGCCGQSIPPEGEE